MEFIFIFGPQIRHCVEAFRRFHTGRVYSCSMVLPFVTGIGHPVRSCFSSPISSLSPSRRRGRDPVIDPELDDAADTPTKRMRIFYSALSSTSSGSMQVGKTQIPSSYEVMAPVVENVPELPEPDWGLLQSRPDGIGYQSRDYLLARIQQLTESLHHAQVLIHTHEVIQEHTTTQLIVQHAHLMKLNQALHAKENILMQAPSHTTLLNFAWRVLGSQPKCRVQNKASPWMSGSRRWMGGTAATPDPPSDQGVSGCVYARMT